MDEHKKQNVIFSFKNDTNSNINKLLEIYINKTLNFEFHTDFSKRKFSNSIFVMRNLMRMTNIYALKMCYFSLFHLLLVYGNLIYKIFILQKKIIRVGVGTKKHCQPLFKLFDIMLLSYLFIYYFLIEIHNQKYI